MNSVSVPLIQISLDRLFGKRAAPGQLVFSCAIHKDARPEILVQIGRPESLPAYNAGHATAHRLCASQFTARYEASCDLLCG
jgi:hypothetical protein